MAIVAVSDGIYANLAGDFVAEHKETGVNVKDVVKLLGCWDALADPTTRGTNGRVTGQINTHHVARRAIAFYQHHQEFHQPGKMVAGHHHPTRRRHTGQNGRQHRRNHSAGPEGDSTSTARQPGPVSERRH